LNLFLGKNKNIKIGDMGVSKIVSNINALHCTRVGTPLYLSPELIQQIPYDFKVDIWSVGCSIYHLACLEPPFQGDNLIVLGNNIVKMPHKQLSGSYSKEFCKIIDLFLSKKPDKRPSLKESLDLIKPNIKVIINFYHN
jgi:NIMA (never in mitosis gene a)-related kinase